MKYFEVELNGETIKLRLTSSDSVEIEHKTGKSILDLIDEYTVTTVNMFLKYLRRSELPQFSEKDACALYDKFIDNGYTIEQIIFDVIYEALCVSGFFKKEKLEKLKKELENSEQEEISQN